MLFADMGVRERLCHFWRGVTRAALLSMKGCRYAVTWLRANKGLKGDASEAAYAWT